MTDLELIKKAKIARLCSYSPYSKFKVGAALLTEDNEVFTGCNVENASYPAGCCAERTALFSAVANGKRNFSKIAVVGSFNDEFKSQTIPCGICLQALGEFCGSDFEIVLLENDTPVIHKFSDFMPIRFQLD